MKIKILKKNELTLGEYRDGHIWLGCSPEDCEGVMHRDLHNFLKVGHPDCIIKSVKEGEPFFCSVGLMLGRDLVEESHAIARVVHDPKGCRLSIDRYLGRKHWNPQHGDKFVIGAYQPTNTSYLPHLGCSVMTSDGLICLEEDQYIGVKDGEIVELSATELLEQLSKHKAARSPRYEAVEVAPTRVRPSRPRAGTIIHNQVTGKLEVFTNNKWKALKLED
jgi:hypothetical protein